VIETKATELLALDVFNTGWATSSTTSTRCAAIPHSAGVDGVRRLRSCVPTGS
jgi:hypothetical protein